MMVTTAAPTAVAPALIGVVGGMGPLASAEFVHGIYRRSRARREQDMPAVVLLSDPTLPDRTASLLAGDDGELLRRLCASLDELSRLGAAAIVICCVTAHHLLDRVPPDLRASVISLVDVVFDELARRPETHLLVCTTGTRLLRIFERHPSWPTCRDRIVRPDERDQASVHEALYRLKANQCPDRVVPLLNGLMDRHGTTAMVAGCTELHLVAPRYGRAGPGAGYRCLDPLEILTHRFATGSY